MRGKEGVHRNLGPSWKLRTVIRAEHIWELRGCKVLFHTCFFNPHVFLHASPVSFSSNPWGDNEIDRFVRSAEVRAQDPLPRIQSSQWPLPRIQSSRWPLPRLQSSQWSEAGSSYTWSAQGVRAGVPCQDEQRGRLAHQKQRPPSTLQPPWWPLMQGGAVSYERGTPE